MDIAIERVKSSPYKFVVSNGQTVGLFEAGKYVSRKNFNESHLEIMKQHEDKAYVGKVG